MGSEANASGASLPLAEVVSIDARTALFREGLTSVSAMTGKPESQARKLVGKWLKDTGDDCSTLLEIIHAAADMRPAEPVSLITASIEARKPKADIRFADKNGNLPGDLYYGVDY